MRILYATVHRHVPEHVRGAERSVDALLARALARGHVCEAVTGVGQGLSGLSSSLRRRLSGDGVLGCTDRENVYETHRTEPDRVLDLLARRLRAFRPDIVLTQGSALESIGLEALSAGVPVIARVMSIDFSWWHGKLTPRPGLLFVSNSRFVAGLLRERTGHASEVVNPIILHERYATARPEPRVVTFVNPIPSKGLHVALQVARLLPHRELWFVGSGLLGMRPWLGLRRRALALPNVRLIGKVQDMRAVYRETKVVLAPAQTPEALCRVLLEAQVSGIPVVASDHGGTPEAILGGGVLLDATAPAGAWAEAIERVFDDSDFSRRLSAEALANARRPELSADSIADHFCAIALGHARCGVERARAWTSIEAGLKASRDEPCYGM